MNHGYFLFLEKAKTYLSQIQSFRREYCSGFLLDRHHGRNRPCSKCDWLTYLRHTDRLAKVTNQKKLKAVV